MSQEYTVIRNDAKNRFETTVDGVLCVLEYRLRDNVLTIDHTDVPEAVGGRGIASVLTRTALDTARNEGWRVIPKCSYAVAYIAKHPEYGDLISRA